MRSQNLDLLGFLHENRDRAVPWEELLNAIEELLNAIGQGVTLSEGVLSNAINKVRRLLGDNGREQNMIQPLHGHGFAAARTAEQNPEPPLDSRESSVQSLRRERAEDERQALIEALRETGGNLTQAGLRLHKSRGSVRYQARKHGLL